MKCPECGYPLIQLRVIWYCMHCDIEWINRELERTPEEVAVSGCGEGFSGVDKAN